MIISFLFIFISSYRPVQANWVNYLNQARTKYMEADYSTAEFFYNAIDDMDINHSILIEKAQNAYRLNNFDKAFLYYSMALQHTNNAKSLSLIYFNLGVVLTENKDFTNALANYKQSIRYAPSKEAKHNFLLLKKKMKTSHSPSKLEEKQSEVESESQSTSSSKGHTGSNNHSNNSLKPNRLQTSKIEKQLDELMKQDAETKRSTLSGSMKNSNTKTKNDW